MFPFILIFKKDPSLSPTERWKARVLRWSLPQAQGSGRFLNSEKSPPFTAGSQKTKQTNENQSSWCIYGISPPMASVHHNCQKHVVRTPEGEASSLCGKAGPPTIVLTFSGRRDGLPLPTALRGGIPAAE